MVWFEKSVSYLSINPAIFKYFCRWFFVLNEQKWKFHFIDLMQANIWVLLRTERGFRYRITKKLFELNGNLFLPHILVLQRKCGRLCQKQLNSLLTNVISTFTRFNKTEHKKSRLWNLIQIVANLLFTICTLVVEDVIIWCDKPMLSWICLEKSNKPGCAQNVPFVSWQPNPWVRHCAMNVIWFNNHRR